MKFKRYLLTATALAALIPNSEAVTTYNTTVNHKVIMGTSQIANGGWAVDREGEIEVGLRARVRGQNTINHAGTDGVYQYNPSAVAGPALWNYDWSVNSDLSSGLGGPYLSGLDIFLGVDTDSSQGVNFQIFSPYDAWSDNQFGNINTDLGPKLSDEATAAAQYNLVQNSQNIGWGPLGLDTTVDGTYDFTLFVTQAGSGPSATPLAQVSIQVIVGAGGAPVPEGGASIALLGLGALALGGLSMRRKAA